MITPFLQVPISPVASRDGEGIFIRDDGLEIPKDILDETELFLDKVHDQCYKVTDTEARTRDLLETYPSSAFLPDRQISEHHLA